MPELSGAKIRQNPFQQPTRNLVAMAWTTIRIHRQQPECQRKHFMKSPLSKPTHQTVSVEFKEAR
jgi:hypothetical protein